MRRIALALSLVTAVSCNQTTITDPIVKNQPPTLAVVANLAMLSGQTKSVTLTATDPEGDALTFSATGLPEFGALAGTTLTFAPGPGIIASTTVTVSVSDGKLSDTKTFVVTVNAPDNLAPTLSMLQQVDAAGAMVAPAAQVAVAPKVRGTTADDHQGRTRLEVEVVPASQQFTGRPTASSSPVFERVVEVALPTLPPGDYRWRARAADAEGLASDWVDFGSGTAFTVVAGTVTGTVSITGGAVATNTLSVSLSLSATSTAGAVTEMRFSNDGTTFSAFQAFAPTKDWALEPGDGTKTVTVEFKDARGNTQRATDGITLDTVAPTISAFVINSDAALVSTSAVTLTLTTADVGSGISSRVASNDGFATQQALSGTAWTLTAGDGVRTVSVRVTDAAGNEAMASDTIVVDTKAPVIVGAEPLTGTRYTNIQATILRVVANDGNGSGVTQICVAGDVTARCEVFGSGVIPVTLPAGEGTKTIRVTVKDAAGLTSAETTVTIVMDLTAPVLTSASINNDAGITGSRTVRISVVGSDALSGIASLAGQNPPDPFDPFTGYSTYALHVLAAGPDGPRTVNVKVRDAAGNVSNTVSANIDVDFTPPTGTASVTGALALTSNPSVPMTLTATDAHGVSAYCARDIPDRPTRDDSCFKPMTANGTATLSADGLRTISVWFADVPGNVSATAVTDTITLDTTPPNAPNVEIGPDGLGNVMPTFYGSVESGTTVRVFDGVACTGAPLATGTAADFNGSGFVVTTPHTNATTNFFVDAVDAVNLKSTCVGPISYRHDNTAPPAPTLTRTPSSPSTADEGELQVTVEANTYARVYSNAGCTGQPLYELQVSGVYFTMPFTVGPLEARAFYATTTDDAGNTSPCSAGVSYVNSTPGPAVPLYPGRDRWNQYIRRDGASTLDASNIDCDTYSQPSYFACVHAGLMRTIAVPGVSSCTGVVATDALGAFTWRCEQLPGAVRVVSVGLKPDKNLSDLLDFDNARFFDNSVSVTVNSVPSISSSTTTWFSNPVVNADALNGMYNSETIYVMTQDRTPGTYVNMGGYRSALVIRPGKKLTVSGYYLQIYGQSTWLEGSVVNQVGSFAVYLASMAGGVLRNVQIEAVSSTFGVYAAGLRNSFFHDISVVGSSYGIYMDSSQSLTFDRLKISNVASYGIYAYSTTDARIFNFTSVNNNFGYLGGNATRLVVANNTNANNTYALYFNGSTAGALLRNVASVNNYYSIYSSSGDNSTVENLVWSDGYQEYYGTGVTFTGDIRFGGAGSASSDCGAVNGMSVSGADCIAAGSSDFGTALRGRALSNSFRGKVTSDDPVSPVDTNGAAQLSGLVGQWCAVSNPYRAWGKDGSTFPSSDNRGATTTGTDNMRLWDWRPDSSNDADLLNTNPCPKNLTSPGFTWNGQTVLRNSLELFEDGVGDEDGLCESNEACVYSRNKGAYQGSGPLVPTSTANCLSGTGFTGIIGYEYQNP